MTAKFSSNIRPFLATMVLDALRNVPPVAWSATTSQAVGSKVSANGNIYAATNSGVTGSVAPSHTSGTATDGTVVWLYIGASTVPGSIDANFYAGIGDEIAWPNDLSPPASTAGPDSETFVLDNLLTLFKLTADNCRLGLANYAWTSGTVYSSYDAVTDANNYPTPFYAIVNAQNIYKCIDNNKGAPSTSQPSGTSTGFVVMPDGYVWKFMGQISSVDAIAFNTVGYMPVQQIQSNDGSAQWNTQQAALPGSISSFQNYTSNAVAFNPSPVVKILGAGTNATATAELNGSNLLNRILVTDGGTNYNSETYATVQNADGSGAAATATVTTGAVTAVSVTTGGTGYTSATVVFSGGGGTGAAATANITSGVITSIDVVSGGSGYTSAPTITIIADGNGASLDSALTITGGVISYTGGVNAGTGYANGAVLVIIGDGTGAAGTVTASGGLVTGVTITTGGTGYTWANAYIIPGTAGAVAKAIMAPHLGHGANIVTELSANTIIVSTKVTSTITPYVVDGTAFRQVSLLSGVRPDPGSGSGLANASAYLGPSHPSFATPGTLNKYLANSGNLLYVNNVQPITHTNTQEELIKITISF